MSDSQLRAALDQAIAESDSKISMKDLTVLAAQNDPFRIDTPAAHRDGAWLANTIRSLGMQVRTIHLRGLHYAVIGVPKPNGQPYRNVDEDWRWLQEKAADAARWLGYVPFDRIVDQRNAPPVVRVLERKTPYPFVSTQIRVEIPDADDIEPFVGVLDFEGVQPYKLVMIGEKSSLEPVLSPIAATYGADLYLPTGCMTETLIHQIARIGAEDGRPMQVFYFADCDPAGWNMAIEVGRKLQAFKTLLYPELEFTVRRVGLLPDQVRRYELPSTPLKDTERRADAWQQAMAVEQTEIDALASLRPELLDQLAREAIAPFYDSTLARRVELARWEWRQQAQAVVDDATDHVLLDRLRTQAEEKLSELREEIDAINNALRLDVRDFDLPTPIVPEPEVIGSNGTPLLDSAWSFVEQCRRLKASRAYENGGVS